MSWRDRWLASDEDCATTWLTKEVERLEAELESRQRWIPVEEALDAPNNTAIACRHHNGSITIGVAGWLRMDGIDWIKEYFVLPPTGGE